MAIAAPLEMLAANNSDIWNHVLLELLQPREIMQLVRTCRTFCYRTSELHWGRARYLHRLPPEHITKTKSVEAVIWLLQHRNRFLTENCYLEIVQQRAAREEENDKTETGRGEKGESPKKSYMRKRRRRLFRRMGQRRVPASYGEWNDKTKLSVERLFLRVLAVKATMGMIRALMPNLSSEDRHVLRTDAIAANCHSVVVNVGRQDASQNSNIWGPHRYTRCQGASFSINARLRLFSLESHSVYSQSD
jgi:hypothetical protein